MQIEHQRLFYGLPTTVLILYRLAILRELGAYRLCTVHGVCPRSSALTVDDVSTVHGHGRKLYNTTPATHRQWTAQATAAVCHSILLTIRCHVVIVIPLLLFSHTHLNTLLDWYLNRASYIARQSMSFSVLVRSSSRTYLEVSYAVSAVRRHSCARRAD